jgi:hypothetical protein
MFLSVSHIWIRKFLGLPDLLVRGMDPDLILDPDSDPDTGSFHHQAIIVRKLRFLPYSFVTSL